MLKGVSIVVVTTLLQFSFAGELERNPAPTLLQYGRLDDRFQDKSESLRECLVIRNDGQYHFEKRVQHLSDTTNSVASYEGNVDSESMGELRRIIKEPHLLALSDFVEPQFPIAATALRIVTVTLPAGDAQRKVGYFQTSQVPGISSTTVPDKNDSSASVALKPLVSWVAHFENGPLTAVQNGIGSCAF
jgi:hypothetical protein